MNASRQIVERLQALNEPPSLVQSFADKTGKSVKEVEGLWDEAKAQARKQYPDVAEDSDRFYRIVTGILKKMVGLKEAADDPQAIKQQVKALNWRMGDTLTFDRFIVKRVDSKTWNLRDPKVTEHSRFGTLDQIVEDIMYVLQHGSLPKPNPASRW